MNRPPGPYAYDHIEKDSNTQHRAYLMNIPEPLEVSGRHAKKKGFELG
jgi:hypothetical protein